MIIRANVVNNLFECLIKLSPLNRAVLISGFPPGFATASLVISISSMVILLIFASTSRWESHKLAMSDGWVSHSCIATGRPYACNQFSRDVRGDAIDLYNFCVESYSHCLPTRELV